MSRWSVTLTEAEARICEWVGKQRQANALRLNRDPGRGPSQVTRSAINHIRGAECEFAASVILNLSWRPTIGRIDQPDIGGLIEVRSTELPFGRLIIKPADEDRPFTLIVKSDHDFRMAGWMNSSEAKRSFPLLTVHGDPAHFVRQSDLRPVEELRDWAHQTAARLEAKT